MFDGGKLISAKPRALQQRALPSSGEAVSGFAARGFFRSGFVCLATLSHSARSSSLRRACGAAEPTIPGSKGGRFIGCGDSDDGDGDGGAPRGLGFDDRAAPPAAAPCRSRLARLRASQARRRWPRLWGSEREVSGGFAPFFGLLADPSKDRLAETVLRFSPRAADPAAASCGRAPTGSRLFGTSMTKRMLCRKRPETRPASAPAP